MEVKIRPEEIRDYAEVAELHAAVFDYGPSCGEAALVALLRQCAGYDPALSLVAEAGGYVIGHVLFTRWRLQLGGEPVEAALLSPLAVAPAWQGRGVGSRLVREGLRRASAAGCALSVLLGHPEYYARFGYVPGMLGTCRIRIASAAVPAGPAAVEERRVRPEDLPFLRELWDRCCTDADLAVRPPGEDRLTDWLSPVPNVRGSVLTIGGEPAAYVRYEVSKPHQPKAFLARDAQTTLDILGWLKQNRAPEGAAEFRLPLHPRSAFVRNLRLPYEEELAPWPAGMIVLLDPSHPHAEQYVMEVQAGARPIGSIIWPTAFDLFG